MNNSIYKKGKKLREIIDKWGYDDRIRKLSAEAITAHNHIENNKNVLKSASTYKQNRYWAVPEKDKFAEAQAITSWVRDRVRYTNDPYKKDIFETPLETLELGIGDCDAFTTLIGSMLTAIGHNVMPKIIKKGSQYHAYLKDNILSKGKIESIAIDGIFPYPIGYEVSYDEAEEF